MSTALLQISRAFDARTALMTWETSIQYEDQAFEPVQGQPWITTKITGRDRQPMGLSAATAHLWLGTFMVGVKHPATEGLRAAYARACRIGDHFPRGLTLQDSGLSVVIRQVGMPPSYTTAGWITQPVVVAWSCEEPAS
jgi:hypothetical protein